MPAGGLTIAYPGRTANPGFRGTVGDWFSVGRRRPAPVAHAPGLTGTHANLNAPTRNPLPGLRIFPVNADPAFAQNGGRAMDKDRIEGSAKQMKGAVKEVAGKVIGDKKLEAEGKAEKAAGKVQNAVGGLKDTLRGK